MNITVLTPDKEIFHGLVTSLKVPGTLGQFQVLKNHAPIVASLEAGMVYIVTAKGEFRYFHEESGTIKTEDEAGKEISFMINSGFVEVLNNEIS